jgi:ribosomal protein L31
MTTLDETHAASVSRLHRTPTLSSDTLGEAFGGRAYLKAELFQKTGSFKPRGMLAKLASLSAEEKARGVISISAGNAAQGLAWACAQDGVDCLVVMWRSGSPLKIAATRSYGAQVDLESADPVEGFERVRDLQASTGRTFVHPYDDPVVIAGHSTLGREIMEDVPDVDVVVVPVGGGGLVAGVALGAKDRRSRARGLRRAPQGAGGRRARSGRSGHDRRRPHRAAGGRASAPDLHRERGRIGPRERRRGPGGVPLSLRTRQAGGRARCGSRSRGASGRENPVRERKNRGRRCLRRQRSSRNRLWYPQGKSSAGRFSSTMKPDIHPDYVLATVRCSCGNEFQTRSTKPELHVEICSECHPFYTGKQKLVDSGGRVERFQRRLERAGRA